MTYLNCLLGYVLCEKVMWVGFSFKLEQSCLLSLSAGKRPALGLSSLSAVCLKCQQWVSEIRIASQSLISSHEPHERHMHSRHTIVYNGATLMTGTIISRLLELAYLILSPSSRARLRSLCCSHRLARNKLDICVKFVSFVRSRLFYGSHFFAKKMAPLSLS